MEVIMLNLQCEAARSLNHALRANAIFSAVSGLIIVFLHATVLQWLGISGISIMALGAGLVLFSAYLFWMSGREQLQKSLVIGVIAGDWAWVMGSVLLIAFKADGFSTFGLFLLTDVALLVMIFAIWQQRALTRLASAVN